MLIRALIAFLALPGVVAGLVPALLLSLDRHHGGISVYGFVLLVPGLLCLLWCVRDFFVSGRGTLAPWDPPRSLVIVGLYRFVRNPMYLAVLMIVLGWSVAAGSRLLGGYTGFLAVVFHLRVLFYEEPRLHRQFGREWSAYSASVSRWVPRIPSRR